MKFITILLAFSALLFISNANALIIKSKDWSFKQTNESWNSISTRYDKNGRLKCENKPCVREYWASSKELTNMFKFANLDSLISGEMFGNNRLIPVMLGARPSLCLNGNQVSCVWHGWLREESKLEVDIAWSALISGGCTPSSGVSCSLGPHPSFSSHPKTFADEGGSGNVAITGHWVYTKVSSPYSGILFLLSLFIFVFIRRKSRYMRSFTLNIKGQFSIVF